jgi:dolichyl-phosphate-mannose--protein O-mannosyl transferase
MNGKTLIVTHSINVPLLFISSMCVVTMFLLDPVTCGSAVKLSHVESKQLFWLSSESRNWVSGSGQQIVTWIPNKAETSALWWLRMSHHSPEECDPGTPIQCGDKIRLTHVATKRNLHTHGVPSPLSKQQEVSGFGDNGVGDGGDDWIVECVQPDHGGLWKRGYSVRLFHVDTSKYLGGSASVKFTQSNCGNCQIINHMEATGRAQKDDFSLVKVEMGVLLSK